VKPVKGYSIYYNKNKTTLDKIKWRLREEYSPALAKQLMGIISPKNVDVLITSTIEDVSCYIWKLAKENNIKTYHILRSYYLLCTSGTMFKNNVNCTEQCFTCKYLNNNKKSLSQYLDNIVGISKFILEQHVSMGYFKKASQHIIGNICFTEDELKLMDVTRQRSGNGVVLGYLGRLHETKGLEVIFDSLSKMKPNNLNVIIAGDGKVEYVNKLKSIVENANLPVEFVGHVDAAGFLNTIDVLIVPSLWNEPFGRIIVEAYATKTPVIVNSTGGMPELVDQDKSGWVYSTESELINILDNLAARLKEDKNFDIVDQFSEDSIGMQWEEIIEN
jgi:glycosyltransferase involved in cell wall biosynthesis